MVYAPSQDRFLGYLSLLEKKYNAILEVAPRLNDLKFQGQDLGEIVRHFPESKGFVKDIKALQVGSSEMAYELLKKRLIDYVRSGQSWGSVRKNVIGGKHIGVLDYISALQAVFDISQTKAENLKRELVKYIMKNGHNPWHDVVEGSHYEALFEEAEREVIEEKNH